ncbi:hypothetical protein OS187_11685 [Xanthomonadaceae bacterium JHOS43]|nr:hypothetical protein [Xanthomonadaceae bacterium JHOS43]
MTRHCIQRAPVHVRALSARAPGLPRIAAPDVAIAPQSPAGDVATRFSDRAI